MSTPGKIARTLLGERFETVGNLYRRIFVDLDRVVDVYASELGEGDRIVDIGGGDGALVERLLQRRPDLKVTMCDVAPAVGSFLSPANRARVELAPRTEFEALAGPYEAATISDVIHHVPVEQRDGFFAALAKSCERWGCRKIILKDVEPNTVRGLLSRLSDHYITGDKHVVLFSRQAFGELAARHFSSAQRRSTIPDWPNYCEVLTW